jgi:3-hydroxyacyl-CoA dehydrogenase
MINDDTIDSAVIENLSQRVAEQQAEIERLTAKIERAYEKGVEEGYVAIKYRAEAAEAKLATMREGLDALRKCRVVIEETLEAVFDTLSALTPKADHD